MCYFSANSLKCITRKTQVYTIYTAKEFEQYLYKSYRKVSQVPFATHEIIIFRWLKIALSFCLLNFIKFLITLMKDWQAELGVVFAFWEVLFFSSHLVHRPYLRDRAR